MRILFLDRDNSARSQMAEALARQMFGAEVDAFSAGVEPGRLHPLAIESMREIDLDITSVQAKTLAEVPAAATVDLIVVVNERDVSEGRLPKTIKRVHWPIMDPADPPASEAELRRRFRDVRMALSKHMKGLGSVRKKLG